MKPNFYILLISILLMSLSISFAQIGMLPIENNVLHPYLNSVYRQGIGHTSIKPFKYSNVKLAVDSFGAYTKSEIYNLKRKPITLRFYPLYYFELLQDVKNTQTYLNFQAGFNVDMQLGKNLLLGADLVYAFSSYPQYLISHPDNHLPPDSSLVLPYYGKYIHENDNSYGHSPSAFYVMYSPSKIFNFTGAYGKNFLGDGYRSLFLSDNSNNYLYFKTSVNVWNFKYIHIVAALKDISFSLLPNVLEEEGGVQLRSGGANSFERKFAYMHFLSWNATKRLNLNIFEAIVQNATDTIGKRGLDVNYLNPIVFFRPVEISVGSPDNAMMGIGFKYAISRSWQWYGQAILDEFLLTNIKQRNGSWTNKVGFQLGTRVNNVMKLPLSAFLEMNYVRPFVYSHENPLQNYGHYYQPLAHPLHSNFIEAIGMIQYIHKKLTLSVKSMYAMYGTDNETSNVGQDIYKSYYTRLNFDQQRDDGHRILQGNKNIQQVTDIRVEYKFESKKFYGLEAFGGFTINTLETNTISNKLLSFYFGAKTPLSVVRKIEYSRNW